GVLEYLGRTDFQVKIRGQRLELGEIEGALLAEARGARTGCVAHTVRTADELVAYVVATPGTPREDAADGPDAAGRLSGPVQAPADRVPTALMELDELPLSANGKIDRAALPAPAAHGRPAGRAGIAPRTEVERVLADIFAEVLEIDDIGVEDGFFDLGGNSLI